LVDEDPRFEWRRARDVRALESTREGISTGVDARRGIRLGAEAVRKAACGIGARRHAGDEDHDRIVDVTVALSAVGDPGVIGAVRGNPNQVGVGTGTGIVVGGIGRRDDRRAIGVHDIERTVEEIGV
jgi:hypothetical protein